MTPNQENLYLNKFILDFSSLEIFGYTIPEKSVTHHMVLHLSCNFSEQCL
jgi:hypothetical protein